MSAPASMRVREVSLRDFRVHHRFDVELEVHTILVGPNGVGKSSVLEALHLAAVGRSFRRVPDEQLIRWGAPGLEVRAQLFFRGEAHQVDCRVVRGAGKRFWLDGLPLERLGDLVTATSVVTTTAEDIWLVEGSPGHARRWLDLFCSQREPGYLAALLRYHQVVRQRNSLLSQAQRDPGVLDSLEAWTVQMWDLGVQIEEWRKPVVRLLGEEVARLCGQVLGAAVEVAYRPGVEQASPEEVRRLLAVEVARGHSLWGPHRAGLEVVVGGQPLKAFASRGEKRTVAMCLKLAQARLMREAPLCLLDDVGLELDERRSGQVLSLFMEVGQVVATSPKSLATWPEGLRVRGLKDPWETPGA